jgi:hypothetical protein
VVPNVLPCRWPGVRRTDAPRPGCPDRLASPLNTLAIRLRLLAETPSNSGPLMEFLAPTTRETRSSDCRFQCKHWFRPSGVPRPDSATPSGFLNLLTFSSAPNPSGLVSCRWRSWALAFEEFSLAVAVPASHVQQAERFTVAIPSADFRALVASDALVSVHGFGHPSSPFPRPELTGESASRSFHDLHLPKGYPPRFSTSRFFPRCEHRGFSCEISSHGLRHDASLIVRERTLASSSCLLCRVSKNRGTGGIFR